MDQHKSQPNQPNLPRLAILCNLPSETNKRDPRPIVPKLIEIKQKAAVKFPSLGLEAYEIIKANDYMYAVFQKTTKEIIIIFTGENVPQIGMASSLVSALQFAKSIIRQHKDCKITLTGIGAGASLAERVAYFTGKQCESFSATPVSASFDPLFHSLPQVTERKAQASSIPRVTEQTTMKKPEETKSANNNGVPVENLNYNELARIKGLYMDESTNVCTFVLRPPAAADSLDISVNDLLTALAIFYDPNINTKHISFSLDPADEKNPQGPQQMKVYWPDKSDGKMILQGTELGEVFFNADFHMKQMSLGVQPTQDGKNEEFVFPEKLKKMGMKPSHQFGEYTKGKLDWSRMWLVVKELKISRLGAENKNGTKYFEIENVVMGVDARQMVLDQNNKLEDMQIQDPTHNSYKFAQKFTELYEDIAKEFPVYHRLKQAAKAVALAQWMWVNRVPIDFARIKTMIKKAANYTNIIPALKYDFPGEVHTLRVFGGVDMGISFTQLVEPSTKSLQHNFPDAKSSQVVTSVLQQVPQAQTIPNPFIKKANCETCSCKLHLAELLYPHEGKFYCTTHHPLFCWGCYEFIYDNYMKSGDGASFHSNCFTCARCDHPLSGQLGMIADTAYMHKDCSSAATKELLGARVKDQPSPSNSTSLTTFQRKLDRLLSLNGTGDAMAYSLIPPSAGSQDGYKLGKTQLDTSSEQLLNVIKDILEKTGMKDVESVIAKMKAKKMLTQQEVNSVNEKLSGFCGKKIIDEIYGRVLVGTAQHIETVINTVTDPGMKSKLQKSEHAKLLLVDYENQWKLDNMLMAFLSGMTVPIDPKNHIVINKEVDIVAEINRYIDRVKGNVTQTNEIKRRRQNVEKVAKENFV